MKKATAVIVKDPENPVPFDVLEQSVLEIAKGMKALDQSRLKPETIVTLIHEGCSVGKPAIRAVLNALRDLERNHLKPQSLVKK